jgi:hypothetical protein
MRRTLMLAFFVTIGAVPAAPSGSAAPVRVEPAAPLMTDLSAQNRPKRKRPQLRVTPRYPSARTNTPYPRGYDFHYPGPNARRECVARLVQEFRPSGPVVVPRMRCWWVPG